MPESRDHGHPDRVAPIPLHLVTTGPVVLVPLPEDEHVHACQVVCGLAAGDTEDEQVADARELLLAVGLIVAAEEVQAS